MVYKLNGNQEEINNDINETFDEKDLLSDILTLNDLETESVRLSASTINQLFKDTNYNLDDVRENKLVRPVALTWLPNEIKQIENTKKRKNLFIQIVLPLILEENNNIKLDRLKLFTIINKNNNTKLEKKWLNQKYKQYGVPSKDLSILKIRMDEIPTSLAIAQAAKETGWGTSRFALEGNALFGQWTWSGEGLKPKDVEKDEGHKVMKFNVLQASVRAYQRNLNTHSSYGEFRKARAKLRDEGKDLDSLVLSEHLDKYAETGKKYVVGDTGAGYAGKMLSMAAKKFGLHCRIFMGAKDMKRQKPNVDAMKKNSLKDFDDAKLLPSSKKLESLI